MLSVCLSVSLFLRFGCVFFLIAFLSTFLFYAFSPLFLLFHSVLFRLGVWMTFSLETTSGIHYTEHGSLRQSIEPLSITSLGQDGACLTSPDTDMFSPHSADRLI